MTNDIEVPADEIARRLVFLKTLADLVAEETKKTKALAAAQFAKGTSIPARSDNDVKLGMVSKTDPKPVAAVVDEDRLAKYIFQTRPHDVVTSVTLGDPAEIVPILIDAGRPDLFAGLELIPDWLFQEMELQALAGKDIPGIEVRVPPGYMTVRVEQAAKDAARELLSGAPMHLGIEATR